MEGMTFYRVYQPIRLHFTTEKYDVIKYNGKVPPVKTYPKILDSWATKFYDKKKAGRYCVANFIYNKDDWIYHDKATADECFEEWTERQSFIASIFEEDLENVSELIKSGQIESWETLVNRTKGGRIAPLLQLLLHDRVRSESVVILDSYGGHSVGILKRWEIEFGNDPLISSQLLKLTKYKPFVNINAELANNIISKMINHE